MSQCIIKTHFPSIPSDAFVPKIKGFCFPKTPKTKMPDLDLILNQSHKLLFFISQFVCMQIRSVVSQCLSCFPSHTLSLYLRLLAMRLFMKAKKLTGLALIPML
jgi:hypothetical protein